MASLIKYLFSSKLQRRNQATYKAAKTQGGKRIAWELTRTYPDCKIVATLYIGTGLAKSVGVDVFKPVGDGWQLCDNKPSPWQGVEHYQTIGRPEGLKLAKPGRMLATINQLLELSGNE